MCGCMEKRDKTYGSHQLHLPKKGGWRLCLGASLHLDCGFQYIIINANGPISLVFVRLMSLMYTLFPSESMCVEEVDRERTSEKAKEVERERGWRG